MLLDDCPEHRWNGVLLGIAPSPSSTSPENYIGPTIRKLTNEDLMALRVDGHRRSAFHAAVQRAIAMAKSRSSAPSSTPSTPSRCAPSSNRTGMRYPDVNFRIRTLAETSEGAETYLASGLEGEVKIHRHALGSTHSPLPLHDDDEDRTLPAIATNHSFHDQWLRGLSKAVVYLSIAFEISGTRLGVSVVSEWLQRLAQIVNSDETRIAVAIEVDEVPQQQPGSFAALLRTSVGQERNQPWRFGEVQHNANRRPMLVLNTAAIQAWNSLFTAAFTMFRDVVVNKPIPRFHSLSVDSSSFVGTLLSRSATVNVTDGLRQLELMSLARPQLAPQYRTAADTAGEQVPDDLFPCTKGSRSSSCASSRRSTNNASPSTSPYGQSSARRRRSLPVTPPRQEVFRSPRPSPSGGTGGAGAGTGAGRSPRFMARGAGGNGDGGSSSATGGTGAGATRNGKAVSSDPC